MVQIRPTQLFCSVHSLLLREINGCWKKCLGGTSCLASYIPLHGYMVSVASVPTGDMGTGAKDTAPLSVRSFQHLHTGYREIPSTRVWILRMPKIYSITPQLWENGKKLQKQDKAEKKLKAADLKISQKIHVVACSSYGVFYNMFTFTEAFSRSGQ